MITVTSYFLWSNISSGVLNFSDTTKLMNGDKLIGHVTYENRFHYTFFSVNFNQKDVKLSVIHRLVYNFIVVV